MDKTKYFSFLEVAILLGMVFAGCGNTSENGSTSAKDNLATTSAVAESQPEELDKSQEPHPLTASGKAEFLEALGHADNLIAWYTLRADYIGSRTNDAELYAALMAKENELREKVVVHSFTNTLDLMAFGWKLLGDTPEIGDGATFVASWLFYKKGAINFETGQSARIFLRGWPDNSHQHYLATKQQPDTRYFERSYPLEPGIDTWKEGEYRLVTQEIHSKLPMIPYRIHTFLIKTETKKGGGWAGLGRIGKSLDLGWYADLGDNGASAKSVEGVANSDKAPKATTTADHTK